MVHKINCKIDPDGQIEMKRRNNSDAEYDKMSSTYILWWDVNLAE